MCVHAIEKNLHYITNDLPFTLSPRKRERRTMRDMHVKKITSYRGTITRNANIQSDDKVYRYNSIELNWQRFFESAKVSSRVALAARFHI